MNILTLNAGSSSIKYKLFKNDGDGLIAVFSGLIEGIGEQEGQWHHNGCQESIKIFSNHQEAFEILAKKLQEALQGDPIAGIGHRVVHGGSLYYKPTVITDKTLTDIEHLSLLAPLHNPVNALGIRLALRLFPKAIQMAIFDNGFHHTMPEKVYKYAIEQETTEKYAIRRYGFHGINHEYVARQAALYLNKKLSDCNLISLHLGNGASGCLIKQGLSYDTSMGMTPLPGLIMGTRCGDIDAAIPLFLLQRGFTAEKVDQLLNKHSGLMGIAGDNDMRNLNKRAENKDKTAKLAISMYVYAIQKLIGSYISQTPSLDALIFTGGVGENAAAIRKEVITPLKHLGFEIQENKNNSKGPDSCRNIAQKGIPILVIRGNEELFMAEQVFSQIRG